MRIVRNGIYNQLLFFKFILAVGVMKPGHAFTIEPMISQGVWTDQTWPDNWTSVTQDGRLSAQFEQTMVVTDKGVEVLTARKGEKAHVPYFMDSV